MDLEKVKNVFDYPDRLTRRSQIDTVHDAFGWVFPPASSIYMDFEEIESDDGSNSDAGTAVDTDSLDHRRESDSDSDEDGDDEIQKHSVAYSYNGPTTKPKTKYRIEEWLKTNNSMLCISGKPGTGKSTLIRYFEEEERTKEKLRLWHPDVWILSHYFCGNGDNDLLSNAQGFLRNLICQTLDLRQKKGIKEASSQEKEPGVEWTESELEKILLDMLADCTVCLFADNISPSLLPLIYKLANIPGWKICFSTSPDTASQEPDSLRIEEHTYDEHLKETRTALWRDLRDSGKTTEQCTDIILEVVNHADGVYLLLLLAIKKNLAELVTKRNEPLDSMVPRSLSDLRSQLLQNKDTIQASHYFNLVRNYRELIEYFSQYCWSHCLYNGITSQISLLEFTLVMRPELRGALIDGVSEELTSQIEGAVQEVKIEITTRCGGLLHIEELYPELWTMVQQRDRIEDSDDHLNLIKTLYTTVRLLPGAATFLQDYGHAITSLDKKTDRQWWLDIVETYLGLTEAGLINKAHIYRALAPLAKIKSPELLERCQKLYNQGKLQYLWNFNDRSYKVSPPFLALAAIGSNFQEFVMSRVGPQATNVLRHLIDYTELDDKNNDSLDFYYESLTKLGDPMEKGILAIDSPRSLSQQFLVFESAIARILKHMLQHPYKANKDWIQRLLQDVPSLDQRTSIAVSIHTSTESSQRVKVGDVHDWPRHSWAGLSGHEITDVIYALEVDLAFLFFVLQRRLGMGCELSYYAELRAIQLRGSQDCMSYKVVHSDNTTVNQLVECMIQNEVVFELNPEIVRKVTDNTFKNNFKDYKSLITPLAESGAGYIPVEREVFWKICEEIEWYATGEYSEEAVRGWSKIVLDDTS